ncbi:response regulator transcription factor, partial [Parasutterella excrementihominis]
DIDMAVNTMIDGATDFLQKPVKADRLLSSVERACTKSVCVSHPLLLMTEDEAKQKLQSLTAREIEILRLVNKEYPSRVIGERLGISERTVETHRTSACKKLQTHSTQEILEIFELARWN